ncbi:MAG: hypothetical protein ACT4O2_12655 [Beijerinckiaceae bacterium]
MGYFSATIEAQLAGREVRGALLVRFDFASQSIWLWPGHGMLNAGGALWSGAGELGKIEGLESPLRGIAPVVTFTLSGVDPYLIAEAIGNPAEYRGQLVTVFLQFFDADWAPLDSGGGGGEAPSETGHGGHFALPALLWYRRPQLTRQRPS